MVLAGLTNLVSIAGIYMPHGYWYLWNPPLLTLHAVSDFLIGSAYVVIGITLYIIGRRVHVRFSPIVLAIGVFIGARGATHFMEIWNLWHASNWTSGAVKGLTAIASVVTAVWLVRSKQELVEVAVAAKKTEEQRKDLANRVAERTRELEDSRNELRQITDRIPSLIAQLDGDHRYMMANAAYERWFGVNRQEIIGQSIESVIGKDTYKIVRENLERAFKGETQNFGSEVDTGRFGGRRYIDISYLPSRGKRDGHSNTGEVDSVIVLVHDVTEQKIAEKELAAAKQRAEDASRSKSEFLANISHEIRTPLGAVLGFAELLTESSLANDEREKYAGVVRRNGMQLSSLIDDVLDLSKVEAGKIDIESVPVSLKNLVNDVIDLFKDHAQSKGIVLQGPVKFEVDRISSDPTRIRQVLINLVGNAIKFTSEGFVKIELLKVERNDSSEDIRIHLRVKDSGIGISEESRSHLFTPFMQGDSSMTRKFGGTGLGLALSKRLSQALNGDLHLIESEPGKGTTFEFNFVTQEFECKKQEDAQQATPSTVPNEKRLLGMRILVAEDSPDNQFLVKRFLTPYGPSIEFVENGAEAVERANKSEYDAILMDIQMPIMNGFEATKALRDSGYKKPIIALTAHAMKSEQERTKAAGCDEHLTKPLDRVKLVETLGRFFRPV